MAKHPHYEVMTEWAQDTSKVVQWADYIGEWNDCITAPSWNKKYYRIKPEKKPDVYAYESVVLNSMGQASLGHPDNNANLRLTFDGETGKLITAEVL